MRPPRFSGKHIAWGAFWIYSAAVIIHAVLPVRVPDYFPSDKILHALEYFLLLGFAGNAFSHGDPRLSRHACLFAFLYCIALGALTEIMQMFTFYRTADWTDWVADIAGAGAGGVVYGLFRLFLPRSLRRHG